MIRKAVGSYGEALFLAVFLAFANKSQVICHMPSVNVI